MGIVPSNAGVVNTCVAWVKDKHWPNVVNVACFVAQATMPPVVHVANMSPKDGSNVWGDATNTTLSDVMRWHWFFPWQYETRQLWVEMHPLGLPVLPLVKKMWETASEVGRVVCCKTAATVASSVELVELVWPWCGGAMSMGK